MSTLSSETLPAARARARGERVGAVAAALATAIALWAIIVRAAGVDLQTPVFSANRTPSALSLDAIVATVLVASLLSWLTLAITERVSSSPRRNWAALAIVGFVISLGGPLSGHGVSVGDRLSLAAFHLLTAAVLIPMLIRSIPRS